MIDEVNSGARPDSDQYFMGIAMAVRTRANCTGNRVGAVIVRDRRIVSTGYNGTPDNMVNCLDGGCLRCVNPSAYPSGTSYDLCICVHAEQNALLSAARFGIAVEGSIVYTTMRPCFGCTKELLQAKINAVHFIHEWSHPDKEKQEHYQLLQARFPGGIRRMQIVDPNADWAVRSRRNSPAISTDEIGHADT